MVIYVEDNPNNQRLMQRMLSKRDLVVDVYDNVEEAYDAIIRDKPELIFVDLHLKTRKNGMDLVHMLRESNVETPIIIVTIFNMIADRKRALEEGCNDYLSKPYAMSDLLRIVDQYLGAGAG